MKHGGVTKFSIQNLLGPIIILILLTHFVGGASTSLQLITQSSLCLFVMVLARQVFALDVGTNSAEEFLLVVGILEIQRFLEAGFVAFVGRLSVGVSKFVNPKLTSLAIEDLGSVFDGGDVVVVGRFAFGGGGSSSSSSGH